MGLLSNSLDATTLNTAWDNLMSFVDYLPTEILTLLATFLAIYIAYGIWKLVKGG